MATDLSLLVPLLAVGTLYVQGLRRLSGEHRERIGWYIRAGAALVVLLFALGPVMEAHAQRSLAMHMVQHQLLLLVAAPLLVTSGIGAALRAVRTDPRTRVPVPAHPSVPPGGLAVTAILAAAVHLAVVLAWHVPYLYELALQRGEIHHLEHLTMLGTAVLAWAVILRAADDERATPAAMAAFALLAIGGAGLGVVLLSSPQVLYETYATATGLGDQRAAGALMKVGALLAYAGSAVGISARWLRRLEDDQRPAGAHTPGVGG